MLSSQETALIIAAGINYPTAKEAIIGLVKVLAATIAHESSNTDDCWKAITSPEFETLFREVHAMIAGAIHAPKETPRDDMH